MTLGSLIRVGLLLAFRPWLRPDSSSYLALAHRLASLHLAGYNGARTPGYPLLLLAVHYSPTATWGVQAFLGVVTSLLLYWTVRRLGGSSTSALVAGLLYATSVGVLTEEQAVLTESLDTFLIAAAGALCAEIVRSPTRRPFLAGCLGLVLALACLVRSDDLALALAVAVGVAAGAYVHRRRMVKPNGSWRAALASLCVVCLPAVAVLAGWAAVNRAETGVTTVTTVTGMNLIDHVAPYVSPEPGRDFKFTSTFVAYRARNEARSGTYFNTSWAASHSLTQATHLDLAHLSSRFEAIALGVIARHPLQYLWLSAKGWPRVWVPPGSTGYGAGTGATVLNDLWKVERPLQFGLMVVFLVLCLADLVRRVSRRRPVLPGPSAVLAAAVLAGTIPVLLLGDGAAGRHGYVYFPVVLAIVVASAEALLLPLLSRRSHIRFGWSGAGTAETATGSRPHT